MRPLTTERLILREFTHDDAPFVLGLHQHPDLLRFIPEAAVGDQAEAHDRIDQFLRDEGPDRGWWCVTLADGTPVGAVLLKGIPGSAGRSCDDIQVGWRQHAAHCGHGYMTEAARAVVELGFAGGLERIIAVVDPDNVPSQQVCGRIGMTHLGRTRDYYDEELELFELRRPR